jgi:hypothetical protein
MMMIMIGVGWERGADVAQRVGQFREQGVALLVDQERGGCAALGGGVEPGSEFEFGLTESGEG